MPDQHPTEELKKNSVTYILGQLTEQIKNLTDKVKELNDGTYARITSLENTKADRVMVDRIQKIIEDNLFKLTTNIRNLINKSFNTKKIRKGLKTEQILGCTFQEFKEHLESQFEPWMNWENRGLYNGTPNYGWDIDHIIPISSATVVDELIKLNHYTNLKPLCSYYNRDIKKDYY